MPLTILARWAFERFLRWGFLENFVFFRIKLEMFWLTLILFRVVLIYLMSRRGLDQFVGNLLGLWTLCFDFERLRMLNFCTFTTQMNTFLDFPVWRWDIQSRAILIEHIDTLRNLCMVVFIGLESICITDGKRTLMVNRFHAWAFDFSYLGRRTFRITWMSIVAFWILKGSFSLNM